MERVGGGMGGRCSGWAVERVGGGMGGRWSWWAVEWVGGGAGGRWRRVGVDSFDFMRLLYLMEECASSSSVPIALST